jgi:hypothetical protein
MAPCSWLQRCALGRAKPERALTRVRVSSRVRGHDDHHLAWDRAVGLVIREGGAGAQGLGAGVESECPASITLTPRIAASEL